MKIKFQRQEKLYIVASDDVDYYISYIKIDNQQILVEELIAYIKGYFVMGYAISLYFYILT